MIHTFWKKSKVGRPGTEFGRSKIGNKIGSKANVLGIIELSGETSFNIGTGILIF